MKRTLSLVLVLCLLLSLNVFAEGAVNDPGEYYGLAWGTSADEIKQIMGEAEYEEPLSDIASGLVYSGEGENESIALILVNGVLKMGETLMQDVGKEDFDAYLEELIDLYGAPNADFLEYMFYVYNILLTDGLDEDYANAYLEECEGYAAWQVGQTAIMLSFCYGDCIELVYICTAE